MTLENKQECLGRENVVDLYPHVGYQTIELEIDFVCSKQNNFKLEFEG